MDKKEYNKQHYQKYKEYYLKNGKEYRLKNREKCLEKKRKYYQENKELFHQRYRKNYLVNKEKIFKRVKEYNLNHPDKVKKWNRTFSKKHPVGRISIYLYPDTCYLCNKKGYLYGNIAYYKKTNLIINGSFNASFRHMKYIGRKGKYSRYEYTYCYLSSKLITDLKSLFFDKLKVNYGFLKNIPEPEY